MKKQLAVYDLDNTLCAQDSFVLFYRFLKKRRLVSLCAAAACCAGYIMSIFGVEHGGSFVRSVLIFSLIKKNRKNIRKNIRDFVSALEFRPELLESIKEHVQDGKELVLLTAAPNIYAMQIGRRLGFSRIVASRPFHSCRRRGVLLLGNKKKDALCFALNLDNYDLETSVGYGNRDDLGWLELLGSYKTF